MSIWLVVEPPTPLKNDGVSNSWDDDIPIYGKIKFMFQTTNQLYIYSMYIKILDTSYYI